MSKNELYMKRKKKKVEWGGGGIDSKVSYKGYDRANAHPIRFWHTSARRRPLSIEVSSSVLAWSLGAYPVFHPEIAHFRFNH